MRRTLLAVTTLMLALSAALYWLLRMPDTLAWAAHRLSAATGYALSFDNVSGSLVGVIHADRVRWRTPGGEVLFEQVELVWSPLALLAGTVAFDQAHVRTARVYLRDEAGATAPVSELPIPLRLRFDTIAVEHVIVQRKSAVHFLEASYRGDGTRATVLAPAGTSWRHPLARRATGGLG